MLPANCQNGYMYDVPQFNIEKSDVEDFSGHLREFHKEFHDCFSGSEARENFSKYMKGLPSSSERKSAEPIALSTGGTESVRSVQRVMSEVKCNESSVLSKYHKMFRDTFEDSDGVLIVDESGFARKGKESAGVSRQYCGSLGKVGNSQVGVSVGYASVSGYGLTDKRLFIPGKWFSDEYSERRRRCGLPEDTIFMTKPQLAAEMLETVRDRILFRYIVADALYGNSPEFTEYLDSLIGKTYMVSVSCDTLLWLNYPVIKKKAYRYKGEVRTKEAADSSPVSVKEFSGKLHSLFWYKRTVCEGSKGPVSYEFTKRRVTLCKDGLPWRQVCLVIKRSIGSNPDYSYYISNAPFSMRLDKFVRLSGMRWAIEQCFEECKSEVGMADYEVRKYTGWNRHMLFCMLAHFFLWCLRIKMGKKSAFYYSIAA